MDIYAKYENYDEIYIWGVSNKASTEYTLQAVTLLGAVSTVVSLSALTLSSLVLVI